MNNISNNISIFQWLYHRLFVLSVDGHLLCFQFLAIMNDASINIQAQENTLTMFLWDIAG